MFKSKPPTGKIAKLDKVFSEFIRLRDANEQGIIFCISCRKPVFWKESDNGHFVNRVHKSLRFSEINCNAQCRSCNRFDESNPEGYRAGLIKKYGEGIIEKLMIAKNQTMKFSDNELEIMIKFYTQKVKELKIEKGL